MNFELIFPKGFCDAHCSFFPDKMFFELIFSGGNELCFRKNKKNFELFVTRIEVIIWWMIFTVKVIDYRFRFLQSRRTPYYDKHTLKALNPTPWPPVP